MKIFTDTIPCTKKTPYSPYLCSRASVHDILFFDIETTGFVTANTTLYLIGVLYYRDNAYHIRQWFNEDGKQEKEMIHAFTSFCSDFSHLVHFNGSTFDLPYLRQKAEACQIPFDIEQSLCQIDIYKEIKAYKSIFSLENLKQKSIEAFLGIERKDTYSGGELIRLYQKYAARPSKELEDILLLHNHDDLLGMPLFSDILNYNTFFNHLEVTHVTYEYDTTTLSIHFSFSEEAFLPKRITYSRNNIYLNAYETTATICLPILSGTLRHYFSDYKNYYYLPQEDMAIHKSVATYVDAENKVKATKKNCYIKKTAIFVPCFQSDQADYVFKEHPEDKELYQTLDNFLTLEDRELKAYIPQIIKIIGVFKS